MVNKAEVGRFDGELKTIAFINHMEGKELDEFWCAIQELIDNEIEQEKYCNQ